MRTLNVRISREASLDGNYLSNAQLWDRGCHNCVVRNDFIIPELKRVIELTHPKSILDWGCGTGYIARHVIGSIDHDAVWTLIDVDEQRIALARELSQTDIKVAFETSNIFDDAAFKLSAEFVIIANTLLEIEFSPSQAQRLSDLVSEDGHLSVFIPDTLSDVVHASGNLFDYAQTSVSLNKTDRFTGDEYPFYAHRAINIVLEIMRFNFVLISARRTDLGGGNFHFCFRKNVKQR